MRERRGDILLLARHFLQPGFALTAAAEAALMRHSWPGNVRELQNCIRRACLLSGEAAHRRRGVEPAGRARPRPPTRSWIAPTIEQALQRARGVIAHAARDLGLSRQALYRRMEKLGLKTDARAVGRPEARGSAAASPRRWRSRRSAAPPAPPWPCAGSRRCWQRSWWLMLALRRWRCGWRSASRGRGCACCARCATAS